MIETLRQIGDYREFLRQIIWQQLHARYRSSILGILWSFLNPLMFLAVLTFVFSFINGADLRTAGIHIMSGFVPWLFFINTASYGMTSITGNVHFVSRVFVPKSIFPLSAVVLGFIDLAAGLVILLALVLVLDINLTFALLFLPVAVLILIVFVTGISFLFATLLVFFRDFQFLWANLSFLWFLVTPIVFHIEAMPDATRRILELNPFNPFIRLFQQPLEYGVLPSPEVILTASIYAGITLLVGTSLFQRSQRAFYLYL